MAQLSLMMKRTNLLNFFLFLFCLYLLIGGPCHAKVLNTETQVEFKSQIGGDDALIFTAHDGKVIVSKNAEKELIPASTLKIFTALVALHYLGPEYKFVTEFYIDSDTNLKIK